jgi:epoxyqueuosine reductase
VAPGELDARRCISYLTIELRGAVPPELREHVGELLYGCDICQDVCPWNVKFARALPDESPFAARPGLGGRDARALAREWLAMTPAAYAAAFEHSAMTRATLAGLKRNAAVVLGNVGTAEDVPALRAALEDPEPMVREHAGWAIARMRERISAP